MQNFKNVPKDRTAPKLRKWASKEVKDGRIKMQTFDDKTLKDILECPKKATKAQVDIQFQEKGLQDLLVQCIESADKIFPKVLFFNSFFIN